MQSKDVPCAVCQSIGSVAAMMQPGSTVCPAGWSTEYKGYVMASPTDARRIEYVCVDGEAEGAADGDDATNTDSQRMAPVEMVFEVGNKVTNFFNRAELTCAHCSKPTSAVQCPPIQAPADGTVACTNMYSHASECTFYCSSGYVLSGFSSVTCMQTTQWNTAVANIKCLLPVEQATTQYVPGAEIQHTGRWVEPLCIKIRCFI